MLYHAINMLLIYAHYVKIIIMSLGLIFYYYYYYFILLFNIII